MFGPPPCPSAVAAKDARILELEHQLTVAIATVDAATTNGCMAEDRKGTICLLHKTAHQTAMATLQTSLDAADRDLLRATAEVVRLTEVCTELTRQNTEFGKRPVACPGVLTAADVMAMIAANPRPEARGEAVTPMETDGGPRVGSDESAQGIPDAILRQCGEEGEDGLLSLRDHPIAPYADAQLAKHLTEYADELLLSRNDADLAAAQQANWMDDMPECIDDIYNRNEALKGTKALATHCTAAPANDSKLDEKLPRPADRQVF
eukprot:gene2535-biopygen3561